MADLMNADMDLIIHDTTNIHFEVDEADTPGGPLGTKSPSTIPAHTPAA